MPCCLESVCRPKGFIIVSFNAGWKIVIVSSIAGSNLIPTNEYASHLYAKSIFQVLS